MKVQELRIGNYIKHPDMNLFRVDAIEYIVNQWYCLKMYPNLPSPGSIVLLLREVEPIPLTEELLLKCGFDENMVLSTIEGEIRYYGDGDINIGGEDSCTLGMVYIAKCKYLHQLQNLYFALTGEELEVKL